MQVQQQQQQRPLQQQQQYYASQPTQAVQGRTRGNANGTGKRPGFASRATMVFGIFQMIFGGICVILGITAIVIRCQLREAGIGIWCGVMFALAGVFGLLASFKKTNAMIITTMVLSIIAATMAGGACITNIIAAAIEEECYYHYRNYYPYDYDYYCDSSYGGRVAVDSILALVTLAELVIAILQSVFCCAAYCCNQTSSTRYQSTMYFAASNQEGVVQGYPMTMLQNPPVQYMTPSGVQFVPQNLNQQQAPQGYMVATQPTVISNQPPSGQMQPQPGVVYQQGQGQGQLLPQQQQQRQQVLQPQPQQSQHQMQPGVQPVAMHQQPLGQQLPQQQRQQVQQLRTQQLQHPPPQSVQPGAVHQQPQPQPKQTTGPPKQPEGKVTGPDVNVNQDQVQSPPTSSHVRDDMSAGLVENEITLA
ncbi:uncharacterized protein [Ptychodera flava]|uniref:uncharacterized protein n=1 Tax=Ptychodera flava TaxID=63121 RepID=UPI00396A28E7